jgi:hypothetical protein
MFTMSPTGVDEFVFVLKLIEFTPQELRRNRGVWTQGCNILPSQLGGPGSRTVHMKMMGRIAADRFPSPAIVVGIVVSSSL